MFWFVLLGCLNTEAHDTGVDMGCNGARALCDRPLDAVTMLGTHNAMSSAERGWVPPNQTHAVPRQLTDGVRGINLDTHEWDGSLWLCHGLCELGAQPLVEGLEEITDFLNANPREVVVITFQSGISEEDTVWAGEAAGLGDLAYHHTLGQPWPTLNALIEANTRVVIFGSGGEHEWLMAQWEHWVDNPYSAQEVSDFACNVDRGDPQTATLFNVNHFITNPVALESHAEQANTHAQLSQHALDCWTQRGQRPNQVLVDFYDIGAGLAVVAELNEMDGGP